jgi:hypothetical protein
MRTRILLQAWRGVRITSTDSWEPKLRKWDSFIEELHEAHFASDEEDGEAETRTDTIEKKEYPRRGHL